MIFAPIMLILLLGVVFLIVYVLRKGLDKVSMTYQLKYKILLGYVVLLLIGTVLYFSFYQDKLEKQIDQVIEVPDIYDIAYDHPRDIRDTLDEWKVEDWEFKPNSKRIELQLYMGLNEGGFNVPVLVDEHDENEKIVRASLFHFPPVYGSNPLEAKKIIPDVRLDNETFLFSYPTDVQELHYYALETDMIHQHFNEENNFDDDYFGLDSGEILYLSVPKGVKVQGEEEFFNVMEIE